MYWRLVKSPEGWGVLLGALLLLGPALSGQVLRKAEDRVAVLDGMASVLRAGHADADRWEAFSSPFVMEVARVPEEVVEVEEAQVEVEPEVRRITEERALALISERFRPLGSLVLGDRGLLQMPGGQRIGQGQVFRATVAGQEYEVEVERVTEEGYQLRLGRYRIAGGFSGGEGAMRGEGEAEGVTDGAEPDVPGN